MKVLVSAYLATKEERILVFVENYLDYMLHHIDEQPFDFWGFARGMEGKEILNLLRGRLGDKEIADIEKKWAENTMDWKTYFSSFSFPEPTDKYMNRRLFKIVKVFVNIIDKINKKRTQPKKSDRDKIIKSRSTKNNEIFLKTHGVNIAMALKYPLYLGGTVDDMFTGLNNVLMYHGNATGIFSSDEHLNGSSPETGIELCTVVEMMYSMEEAIRLTSSMKACDNLEFYAYNALLATISNDFSAHQYVQQANQFDCEVKSHPFYDTNRYGNTFGIEPNYGCCTANMHQGWPKMMLSAVMKSDEAIVVNLYVTGTFKVDFPDGHIMIDIQTQYPFSDTVKIKCLESSVSENKDLVFRIPYMADVEIEFKDQEVNVTNLESYRMKALAKDEELTLNFLFSVKTVTNPDQSISVRRGPLLFCQKIESEEFYIKGSKPFHDRGYRPKKHQNYALLHKEGHVIVKDFKRKTDAISFFKNDITLIAEAFDIEKQTHIDIELKPYGMSVLRKTHFLSIEK